MAIHKIKFIEIPEKHSWKKSVYADVPFKVDMLRGMGVLPSERFKHNRLTGFFRPVRSTNIHEFLFSLSLLLRSGISLIDGLQILGSRISSSSGLKNVVTGLIRNLQCGQLFSEALSVTPAIFDRFIVGLVQIGEQSGDLAGILARLVAYMEWRQDLRQQVIRAISYPLFLLVLMTALCGILAIILVPQISHFLESMNAGLPRSTRFLLAIVDIFRDFWLPFCLFFLAFILSCFFLGMVCPGFRKTIDRLRLSIPLAGPSLLLADTTRLTQSLHILLEAGIPLVPALEHANATLANSWIRSSIAGMIVRIKQGEMLSQAMERGAIFSPVLVRIIAAGENSGNLAAAFVQAESLFSRSLRQRLSLLTTFLGPASMVIPGIFLLWIAVAVFSPLYEYLGGGV